MMWRPARSASNIREPECRLSSPKLYIKDHHPNKIKDKDQVTTFRFNLHPIIRFTPSREFGIFTVSSMLLLLLQDCCIFKMASTHSLELPVVFSTPAPSFAPHYWVLSLLKPFFWYQTFSMRLWRRSQEPSLRAHLMAKCYLSPSKAD